MRRIGVLMGLVASDPEAQSRVVAFENGLRELGWVKGRNLSIEYRWAGDGNVRDHATELLAMAPDLILANSTPVTTALREQSRAVPIVFTQVADPVGQGLVPNLAHPGGNLTGFTSFEFSIGTKWLEALKQTAPRVTRVALAFNPQSGRSPTCSCGRSRPRRHPSQWRRSGPPCATPSMSIAYSIRSRYFAESGGLMSYGIDGIDVFRRAAAYVDRILKGTSPGELPIQAPTKYELVINLKTAKALGLEIPPTLLARADEVIE